MRYLSRLVILGALAGALWGQSIIVGPVVSAQCSATLTTSCTPQVSGAGAYVPAVPGALGGTLTGPVAVAPGNLAVFGASPTVIADGGAPPSLAGLVPYTGASGSVDLGVHALTATGLTSKAGAQITGNADGNGLSVTGDAAGHPPVVFLNIQTATVTARNWVWVSNNAAFGNIELRESTANNANPYSSGNTRLAIASGGATSLSVGSDNTVVCWKAAVGGLRELGYATVAEITAGTCH